MSCMCGDLYCWSCGPAQGNCKCPNCGVWTDEGGCKDLKVCDEANRLAAIAEADQLEEEAKLAKEYHDSRE